MTKEVSAVAGEYFSNAKAPPQLLGLDQLLNPFVSHTSSQRSMMYSSHTTQAQTLKGCEHPRVFSGYETIVGRYEHSTTTRDQDVQILDVIPRFVVSQNMNDPTTIHGTPYYTIVYKGAEDGKVGYFNLEQFTKRSEGFGYTNHWLNLDILQKGNFLPKNVKLSTSPAHKGSMYCMGTNLRVAYMSLPQVTEDAFLISESAKQQMESEGYGVINIRISPNQIPLNLYGDGTNYKFFPDIGEKVREDGVLTAIRTPTAESIVYDTAPGHLTKIQHLHDNAYYVPIDAEVIDVQVTINRGCKLKTPREVFNQLQKYRDGVSSYNLKLWACYQEAVKNDWEITPDFNNLITRALSELLVDGVRVSGYSHKATVKPVSRKETIEFANIQIIYKYANKVNEGFKVAGRYGNKGVVATIVPDQYMPVDEQGLRAQLIISPESVFNRMNPGQWYEQYFNRLAELLQKRLQEELTGHSDQESWTRAYETALDFLNDLNPNWAKHLRETHPTVDDQNALVQDILNDGFYIQMTPFQDNVDQHLVIKLRDKWGGQKSCVTFSTRNQDGSWTEYKSKRPVMIGKEYFHLLYKMPHMRAVGIGHINQYRIPVRPSPSAKAAYPIQQRPIRLGEDEIRNITTTSGAETAAHILGVYANAPAAVEQLGSHLLFDEHPSQLEKIEMTLPEILQDNNIIGVTKHIFSCAGININPDPAEVARIVNDLGGNGDIPEGDDDGEPVEEVEETTDNEEEGDEE